MKNLEFLKRVISSLILIPIITYVVLFNNFFFKVILIFLLIITLFEWLRLVKKLILKIFGFLFILFSFYCVFFVIENKPTEFFYSIIVICILTDIGGYCFGKMLGGPKLTKISPNKTYSGVIGSFFLPFMIFFFINSSENLYLFNFHINFEIIFFLSLVSQIGDLIISFFKRIYKIKDTGRIIPGHGGLLDRIDGMLFVFPFVYFMVQYKILFF